MPQEPDTMSVADAAVTLLLLTEWTPPVGLTVTVSSTCRPDEPRGRVVNVVLSAGEGQFCVINIGGVPDTDSLNALTKAARLVLEAAWEQPACIGLDPTSGQVEPRTIPTEALAPGGPLELRSSPHPIYDTTRIGRDM